VRREAQIRQLPKYIAEERNLLRLLRRIAEDVFCLLRHAAISFALDKAFL
jgi:hypothetical protein